MEQSNSFTGGLNTDTTKALLKPNEYRDARNFHLVTQGSDSTGALVNYNGNEFLVTIPQTSNILKLTITGTFPLIVSFNINGIIISGTVNSYQDITDLINKSVGLNNLGISGATGDSFVSIWSTLLNNLSITLNIVGTPITNTLFTAFIGSQSNLQIIGWSIIRNDFILFTTNNKTLNPGGHNISLPVDPSSIGQIWRLSYDVVSFTPTLTLLYNNFVDFTTYHPFRKEGQSEGRYENSTTKKVYWSDNFNTLRSFNTVDPNGFALDPILLDYRSKVNESVAILQKINDTGGILPSGAYQTAYRLTNTGGGATVYSKCSNIAYVINNLPDSTGFPVYIANGSANSGKSITWKINDVDINYDRIEIVVLYRLNRTDIPIIDTIFNEPVPQSGIFSFTYTGQETTTPVDLNTFLDTTNAFTHCKTIVSKDNLLLVGNTRNKTFDVNFDARAYRFAHVNDLAHGAGVTTIVNDSQGNQTIVNPTVNPLQSNFPIQWNVPELHDAINPDPFTQDIGGYRFQQGGTIIGGSGPNISYIFKTIYINGDDEDPIAHSGFSTNTTIVPYGYNSRATNPEANPNFTLNNNIFNTNDFYDSFKSPYKASALKGYQHNEIYSFAIRFYDKQGRPGFAKWIADIRMPLIYETIDPAIPTYSTYPISDRNGYSGTQRLGILVPEFTVNIPIELQGNIGGWEILRCERTTQDKSVLASGSIHPISFNIGKYYTEGIADDNFAPGTENAILGFKSPEFGFLKFPGFQTGDKLVFGAIQKTSYIAAASGSPQEFLFVKNYDLINPNVSASAITGKKNERLIGSSLNNAMTLLKGASLPFGVTVPADSTINNTSDTSVSTNYAIGDITTIIDIRGDSGIAQFPFSTLSYSKYYTYYTRPKISNFGVNSQYGGNTYSQRSNRQYISTGQFQPILPTTIFPIGGFVVDITGGDIYTTIWDTQKRIKGYVGGPYATGGYKSITYFNPVETVLNTEWKPFGVNKNGIANTGTGTNDAGDDYQQYNDGFAFEDNTKKGFPKPIEFLDIQENDNRIYASAFKINGETTDSWGIFASLDYQDADGQYGPLNNLLVLKGNVFGLQDTGTFMIPVNQRVTIPDNSNATLLLGTGDKLIRPSYISTTDGCQHQWGNIATEDCIYFFNGKNSTFNRLTNESETLSFMKGVQSYFDKNILGDILKRDNTVHDTPTIPRAGVLMTYDSSNIEVLATFHDYIPSTATKKAFTICYSDVTQAFTSFYDFTPGLYFNDKINVFSQDNLNPNNLYIHGNGNPGQFYGITYPSTISLVVYPQVKEAVFDNLVWNSDVTDITTGVNITDQTFDKIRVYNDYQNSDFQALTVGSNLKRKKRNWTTIIPRSIVKPNPVNLDIFNPANLSTAQMFINRMRGKYIQVDLSFPNVINGAFRRIICSTINTIFRFNHR